MGLFEQSAGSGTPVPATVLTSGFQAHCTLNIMGMLQTFINDEQKGVFTLRQATLYGLETGNPAASINVPDLFVAKHRCHLIAFDQMMSHEHTGLMPRQERLAVYTTHYVIQGNFHLGSDALVSDFIDSSRAQFIGATDVHIFPLFRAQAQVIQFAPLVYVHRDQVQMHHAVSG